MSTVYDVIIIGAGPAGLSAGHLLKKYSLNYLIIEKGKLPFDRTTSNNADVMSGVGGGGLFSDGKLSFPPSGSWLWNNLDCDKLKNAYIYLKELLKNCGIDIPDFEHEWLVKDYYNYSGDEKKYKSIIMSNYCQACLLDLLYSSNKDNLLCNCTVCGIKREYNHYLVLTSSGTSFLCNQIIFASGKYGYTKIKIDNSLAKKNRLEMGIRFECPTSSFKPSGFNSTDYKYIGHLDNGDEIRTFCCCKNGIVLKSEFDGYISFNSSSVQGKTNRSSIGVIIRSENENSKLYKEMAECQTHVGYSFEEPANVFFYSGRTFIGSKCDGIIKEVLKNRIIDVESALNESFVFGPETEYIGQYLCINNDLEVNDSFYVIGDATGTFRGLLPALISGIYIALNISLDIEKHIENNISKLAIKISNSKPMDLIFTAQSKNYFYCRDVLCQFVLEKGKLPINPFRVFDYFLSDRVGRDIIRQGNNQLIRICEELWVFGPIADGVLFEIALAKNQNKKIRFFSISSSVNEIIEISDLSELIFEPEVHSKRVKREDLINFISNNFYDDMQLRLEW